MFSSTKFNYGRPSMAQKLGVHYTRAIYLKKCFFPAKFQRRTIHGVGLYSGICGTFCLYFFLYLYFLIYDLRGGERNQFTIHLYS